MSSPPPPRSRARVRAQQPAYVAGLVANRGLCCVSERIRGSSASARAR